jgi:hypothetical protein
MSQVGFNRIANVLADNGDAAIADDFDGLPAHLLSSSACGNGLVMRPIMPTQIPSPTVLMAPRGQTP